VKCEEWLLARFLSVNVRGESLCGSNCL